VTNVGLVFLLGWFKDEAFMHLFQHMLNENHMKFPVVPFATAI